MTRKLHDILNRLSDETIPLDYPLLGSLSDLNSAEMAQFQRAWQAFSQLRRLELLATLIELAEDHIEYDYRSIFRWTLDDSDPAVRALSVTGLWEDEHPQLIPVLTRLLQHDEDLEVRAAAALALGRFVYLGEIESIHPDHAEAAGMALWDALNSPHEHAHVRRRALEGISASGEPSIIRVIESALYEDNIQMRIGALYAMGRNADPRWIPYLVPELRHRHDEVRLEAVRALGELEARVAVSHIIELIEREAVEEIRLAALEALGLIGGPASRKALEAASEWDDEIIALAAREALEELLFSEGSTFELINEILGIEEDDDLDLNDLADDLYEDPLEVELRQLLDERDEWRE